ncbi:ganglioside GM2 activator-like [Mizuhopecten yessoensis]|uniref:Ganglioside GM2 activator n=1 Tax=Mizuhopecten yessoensis TaxID=6573 RepID=A0A210QUR3_MIZYE|nr:ganglioside GM2 activator-like [Mizuhopecten yessoensis]OWF52488.1 Ganglioside GM2 activator [Mizuhopecten yessoensis]
MSPSVFTIASVLVVIYVLCPVSAIYVNNCMRNNPDNILHVREANTNPSNIVAPGNLLVNGNFDILHNVTSELELSVVVKKKIWFVWVTAHRSTHRLCDLLNTEFLEVDGTTACPSQLASAGIPCRCPFTQGRYTLPLSSFNVIKPDGVPYGRYWVKARLRDQDTGDLKACYAVDFRLSRN